MICDQLLFNIAFPFSSIREWDKLKPSTEQIHAWGSFLERSYGQSEFQSIGRTNACLCPRQRSLTFWPQSSGLS